MAQSKRDENRVTTLIGVSNVDGVTPELVYVDPATNRLLVSAVITAGGAGDGAILDGVSSTIKATVLDYASSNPVAVRLTDTGGDYVAAGAGTQYTEDAAAAANPVGGALNLVRDDARGGSLTTTDGDNVAARGTNAGELYVKHVDSIAVTNAGITTIAGAVAGTEMQVDVLTLPAITIAAAQTLANVTTLGTITNVVHVDDNAGSLTVDNAGLTALNGAIAGTEVQVDVLTMPTVAVTGTFWQATQPVSLASVPSHDVTNAGTFAVQADTELTTGDLDTGAGTDTRAVIGLVGSKSGGGEIIPGSATDGLLVNLGANNDVTVTGTVTANLGTIADVATQTTLALIKAKTDNIPALGQALAAGSVPVVLTAAQLTTLTPQTDALTDTQLRATAVPVSLASVPSHAVTNAGTFAVQVDGSALTALQLIDDTVFADDAAFTLASSKVSMAGAIRDDALAALTAIEGDAVPLRVDATGALWVIPSGTTVVSATNLDIRDLTSTDIVTVTGGAGQTADVKITLDSESVAVTNAGITTIAGAVSGTEMQVDIVAALPTGANAIGKLAANSGIDIGDVDVTSIVPGTAATNLGKAEDGAHSSGDVGVMALGVRNDTPNAALAGTDLDYSPIAVYKTGALRVAPPEEDFAVLGSNSVKKYYTNAGAVTDGIVWSPAAGKRWYVTDIFINVSAAATVTLEDDLAAGDSVVWKAELAANSGWSHKFSTPLFSGEDAADLLVTTSAANVYIMVVGYEI